MEPLVPPSLLSSSVEEHVLLLKSSAPPPGVGEGEWRGHLLVPIHRHAQAVEVFHQEVDSLHHAGSDHTLRVRRLREQAPAFQSHHLLLPLLLPDRSPDPSGRLRERRHGADGVGPLPGPSLPGADVGPGGIQDGFRGGGSGIRGDGQGYVEAVPLVPLPSLLIQHVRIVQPPLRGGQRIGWLLPVRLGLLSPRPVYEGEPLDGIHELAQLGPGHARIRHDPAQVIGLEVEGRGVLEEPVLGYSYVAHKDVQLFSLQRAKKVFSTWFPGSSAHPWRDGW